MHARFDYHSFYALFDGGIFLYLLAGFEFFFCNIPTDSERGSFSCFVHVAIPFALIKRTKKLLTLFPRRMQLTRPFPGLGRE